MIAHVILAKRGTPRLAWFDYLVPEELVGRVLVGQLVTVPFRAGQLFGVIKSLTTVAAPSSFRIKSLTSIVNKEPALSADQLAFLEEMGVLYHTSLGFLVKNNLPPLQKRKIQKWPVKLASNQKKTERKFPKPGVFVYSDATSRLEYLVKHTTDGQTLILVPEVGDIESTLESLPVAIREKVVTVQGVTSPKNFFALWQQLWSGEKTVVIGTRRAILLPYHNLRTIIVDDEGNDNHKSFDLAPRFHARDAALILAKHHQAQLHLLSHAPSVETYYFAKGKVYEAEGELLPIGPQNYTLLDIQNDRRGGTYNALTIDLSEQLKANKAGTIFLFCHRRGTLGYVSCRDCKTVVQCPKCEQPLAFHASTRTLECHHCGHTEPMRATCHHCQGTNIAMFGSGTDAVQTELKTLLPNDPRQVVCIDSDSEKLSPLDKNGGDLIIIGTQLAWPQIPWGNISLMAFIDIDTPLFVPEYKTTERVWQLMTRARYLLPSSAHLYLQTAHPEHPLFQGLAQPKLFYDSELKQRQAFHYPPYQFILRLFTSGKNEVILKREMQTIYMTLKRLTKNESTVTITTDSAMFPCFQRGLYWRAIVLKLPYAHYKKIIRSVLTVVPETWKVDPNPTTLLSW